MQFKSTLSRVLLYDSTAQTTSLSQYIVIFCPHQFLHQNFIATIKDKYSKSTIKWTIWSTNSGNCLWKNCEAHIPPRPVKHASAIKIWYTLDQPRVFFFFFFFFFMEYRNKSNFVELISGCASLFHACMKEIHHWTDFRNLAHSLTLWLECFKPLKSIKILDMKIQLGYTRLQTNCSFPIIDCRLFM